MLQRPLDLGLLETLVVASDEGSFSRAATRLGITQQAVSGQIKKLEATVGQQLVERTTRSMKLTRSGEALVVYARMMLDVSEQARLHFSAGKLDGTIRLGFMEAFATTGLPVALQQLLSIDKRLEIITRTAETYLLMERLRSGALDLVLGCQRVGEVLGEVLFVDTLHWAGDPRCLGDPARPIPLVLPTDASPIRAVVLDALAHAGRTWTVMFESDSRSSLAAAALAGIGVTAFTNFMQGEPHEPPHLPESGLPALGDLEIMLTVRRGAGRFVETFADIIRLVVPELNRVRLTHHDPVPAQP